MAFWGLFQAHVFSEMEDLDMLPQKGFAERGIAICTLEPLGMTGKVCLKLPANMKVMPAKRGTSSMS